MNKNIWIFAKVKNKRINKTQQTQKLNCFFFFSKVNFLIFFDSNKFCCFTCLLCFSLFSRAISWKLYVDKKKVRKCFFGKFYVFVNFFEFYLENKKMNLKF